LKAIFGFKKHSYLKAIGTFIIAAALIAGAVGCEGEGEEEYTLTMAVNPAGAGTATDETGTSPYAEGEAVDIKAVANAGYQFVEWSDTGAFADARSPETTFTMPAADVTVTADFEVAPPDHLKGYWVDPAGGPPNEEVILQDQFGTITANVTHADLFCNPVEKMHDTEVTPISYPENHLTIYNLEYTVDPISRRVEVTNQFGTQELTVYGPVKLAVPTQKVEAGSHLPCVDFDGLTYDTYYYVTDTFTCSGATMTVKQFEYTGGPWTSDGHAWVDNVQNAGGSGLDINCNNANINFDFGSPLDGLSLLYGEYGGNLNIDINGIFQNFEDMADIDGLTIGGVDVTVADFGGSKGKLTLAGTINSFDIGGQELWIDDVCPTVPYEPPQFDHYLLYAVIESPPMDPVLVILNDQFEAEPDADVIKPAFLGNPVAKTHGDEVTDVIDWDTHLMFYDIAVSGGNDLSPTVDVEAKNQFGDQNLVAYRAAYLAVPSEKTVLPPPALNHFKGYWVDPGEPVPDTPVLLEDQFHTGEPISATVMYEWYFFNPVEKWIDEGRGTPIWHADHHLYVYGIDTASTGCWQVEVSNQFGGAQLLTVEGPVGLAVPTQKGDHDPPEHLDHYLLYWVVEGTPVEKSVDLSDQFIEWKSYTVTTPFYFANPVQKTHGPITTPIEHPNAHLVLYGLEFGESFSGDWIAVENQFGPQMIVPFYPGEGPPFLGVPSTKLWWETYTCPP
jgi:uncharacterized repeat protein (TIGR02543 family)